MFRRVKTFLRGEGPLHADQDGNPHSRELQLAAAALLLEGAYGDEECTREEKTEIIRDLSFEFAISHRETKRIIEDADEIRLNHESLRPLIEVINHRLTREQRVEVLSLVWRVILADGVVQQFEKVYAEWLVPLLGLSAEEAKQASAQAEVELKHRGPM